MLLFCKSLQHTVLPRPFLKKEEFVKGNGNIPLPRGSVLGPPRSAPHATTAPGVPRAGSAMLWGHVPQQHAVPALDLPQRGGTGAAPRWGEPPGPSQGGGQRKGAQGLRGCGRGAERGGRSGELRRGFASPKVPEGDPVLLEPHEELALCKYYEKRLLDFCAAFKPSMPRSVVVSEARRSRSLGLPYSFACCLLGLFLRARISLNLFISFLSF